MTKLKGVQFEKLENYGWKECYNELYSHHTSARDFENVPNTSKYILAVGAILCLNPQEFAMVAFTKDSDPREIRDELTGNLTWYKKPGWSLVFQEIVKLF